MKIRRKVNFEEIWQGSQEMADRRKSRAPRRQRPTDRPTDRLMDRQSGLLSRMHATKKLVSDVILRITRPARDQ